MTCNDLIFCAVPADAMICKDMFIHHFLPLSADAFVLYGYVLNEFRFCMDTS